MDVEAESRAQARWGEFFRRRGYAVVSLVLGGLLVFAATMKGLALADGAPPPAILSRTAEPLVWALVLAEAVLGLWLTGGYWPRAARRVALVAFAGMLIVATAEALAGASNCGCFGALRTSPWIMVAIDLAALAALVIVPLESPSRRAAAWGRWAVAASVGTLALVFSSTGQRVVVMEPETWVGRRLPVINDIKGDVSLALASGDWLVLFYRYDCPHCRDLLSRIMNTAGDRRGHTRHTRIALVCLATDCFPTRECPGYLHFQLPQDRKWLMRVPSLLSVRGGIVTRVHSINADQFVNCTMGV